MFFKFTGFLFVSLVLLSDFAVNANGNIDGIANISTNKFTERPIPKKEWNENVKLWVARSCAGEAGFDAVDECIGIAWVYATRWNGSKKVKFIDVVRKYSAAIKHRSTHARRWILNLNLKGDKPVGWPHRLRWNNHRGMWNDILIALDEWAMGRKPNPVLGADHFGGSMDKPGKYWVRIFPSNGMKFRNRFYRSPWAPPVLID